MLVVAVAWQLELEGIVSMAAVFEVKNIRRILGVVYGICSGYVNISGCCDFVERRRCGF